MSDEFRVVKTLISDPASDEFLTTPMDLQGEITGADHLQLFNTIKVNVSVEGFGRNDYKFYRGVVFENNANLGVLLPGTVDAWDALINSFITDGTAAGCDLVDSVGNNWLVASTQRNVQMRQLHRKRKKKVVTP
jgi:hypothetical protein